MKKTLEIQIPSPEYDQPKTNRLFLIGLAGMVLGVFISYLSAKGFDPPQKPKRSTENRSTGNSYSNDDRANKQKVSKSHEVSVSRNAGNHRVSIPRNDKKSSTPIAQKEEEKEALNERKPFHSLDKYQPVSTVESSSKIWEPQPIGSSRLKKRRFRYGRVAYIRCEGVRKRKRRFPCPRDKRLESATWSILKRITDCQIADTGTGYSDIRLVFRRSDPTTLEIIPFYGKARNLDHKAVYECVGNQLTQLTTFLKPEEMIVSFQFGLQ